MLKRVEGVIKLTGAFGRIVKLEVGEDFIRLFAQATDVFGLVVDLNVFEGILVLD